MRTQLARFYVDANTYKYIQSSACSEVKYISKSDELPIKKMDFIIFTDNKGNEQLRNFWELSKNIVHYTIGMFNICNDFSLAVVLTNLYTSIMHLRHDAYTEKKHLLNKFPLEMVIHEIKLIELCLELLDGNIAINQFINELHFLTIDDENYNFESSTIILNQYKWSITPNIQYKASIENIRIAVSKINTCLSDKRNWHNIWQLAYKIHNEPEAIYRSLYNQ